MRLGRREVDLAQGPFDMEEPQQRAREVQQPVQALREEHQAENRRERRAADLDRAAKLLDSVTAWIQPPPLPQPSQPGTPERVQ